MRCRAIEVLGMNAMAVHDGCPQLGIAAGARKAAGSHGVMRHTAHRGEAQGASNVTG